ncbi:hypothetical protein HG536_0C05750 [Torulaspora globosa]|uniref:Pre-rRNA-processing protein TSR2 n=1 Tax=Torulaspora globosa TaxID=48254 RepID=A0A7G3ZFX0_9SACH|nr:uncharacterized protein HG536_0C05750 [Torulaspora globosa]QLL32406.1 hypothetical protein HG536_0C05750 [Torulaspora globosa]
MSCNADDCFVEAAAEEPNLKFKDEKQQARFELGVSMMIYKWEALDVAVANNWGGPASAEKRDWITAIVVDLFKDGKYVDAAMVEETLLYAMIDEFDTNVEDESALPISSKIIEIYKQCRLQDYSTVEELYTGWLEKQNNAETSQSKVVVVQEDPLNPDVSSSEESAEEEDEQEQAEDAEDADVEMADSRPNQPVVDEDGFELVQKKGRR